MKKLNTETRQQQIIETALDIIMQGGIQSLTMKTLARQIGISEQAIYRHFKNKLAILTAIISYFDQCFKDQFNQLQNSGGAIEHIRAMANSHLEYFSEHPAVAAVIFSEEIFQNETVLAMAVREALEKRIEHLGKLISKGQQNGEIKTDLSPESLAHILLGSMRLMITRWRLSNFSFDLTKQGQSIIEDYIHLTKT